MIVGRRDEPQIPVLVEQQHPGAVGGEHGNDAAYKSPSKISWLENAPTSVLANSASTADSRN